jgi:hypothetical protein
VAEAGFAAEDRELVLDEPATATGEDGRKASETCVVLLAPVGRGTSDAPAVQGDVAADLGVAVAGGVRAGGYWPGEMLAKGKREEWWSVRELLRNAPKLPVGSGPEGAATTFHGYWYGFRRAPDAGCENNRN